MDPFCPDYAQARARFVELASGLGAELTCLALKAKGPHDGALSIDIARFGAPQARRVWIHSSGLHGLEGFAGSAIQLDALSRPLPSLPADTALLFVHVLNPYGMAWVRRWNESGVDLNRNFLAPHEPYSGSPAAYADFDPLINPPTAPGFDLFTLRAGVSILRHGMPTVKQVVVGGQYDYPKGLFYGGGELEEGPRLYSEFLAAALRLAEHIVAVDVHTGLGKRGQDTLLVSAAEGPDYQALRAHFGERVAPWDPAQGVAYAIRGGYLELLPRLRPAARCQLLTQEFGTQAGLKVLQALRQDQRAALYGDAGQREAAKVVMMQAFCPPDPAWRGQILARGRELLEQSIQALLRS